MNKLQLTYTYAMVITLIVSAYIFNTTISEKEEFYTNIVIPQDIKSIEEMCNTKNKLVFGDKVYTCFPNSTM